MKKARTALALGALLLPCAKLTTSALADIINLNPSKDNTIFSDGNLSNAKGSLFAGQASFNADFALRRSLIQFDIASAIPAGSTIENVTLTLNAARSSFGGESSLHRLLSDWGEGTSNAGSSGSGAAATNGDATWLHTFFNFVTPQFWNTPGGDFVPDASSSQFV